MNRHLIDLSITACYLKLKLPKFMISTSIAVGARIQQDTKLLALLELLGRQAREQACVLEAHSASSTVIRTSS